MWIVINRGGEITKVEVTAARKPGMRRDPKERPFVNLVGEEGHVDLIWKNEDELTRFTTTIF